MLEPPDIAEERIIACLQAAYGLQIAHLAFLPLGADQNTAAYRATDSDGTPFFVKLRRGAFNNIAVALPKLLHDQGVADVIAPLTTTAGQLSADLNPFRVIVYPFVEGRDGYTVALTPEQWIALGTALRRLHTVVLPPALAASIPRETYPDTWRESLRASLESLDSEAWPDPIAAELAAFLRPRREEVLDLVARAERYARLLAAAPPAYVVCHSDVHPGNLLVDTHGRLYLVDWDEPILAPKERDLMFIGGKIVDEEERLFYQGYGAVQVNRTALTYYRYERIIQDLAIFSGQLLRSDAGGADRRQSLHYLMANWEPNGSIATARRTEAGP
ncbi:MAG: phosphotransferase [Anaerolineae bacterium]